MEIKEGQVLKKILIASQWLPDSPPQKPTITISTRGDTLTVYTCLVGAAFFGRAHFSWENRSQILASISCSPSHGLLNLAASLFHFRFGGLLMLSSLSNTSGCYAERLTTSCVFNQTRHTVIPLRTPKLSFQLSHSRKVHVFRRQDIASHLVNFPPLIEASCWH